MIMLLWAMSNLFISTWQGCRELIADFTLQMEVNTAMQRIVDDLRTAKAVEKLKLQNVDRLAIHSYVLSTQKNEITESVASGTAANEDMRSVYYYRAANDSDEPRLCIYRQRRAAVKTQPITGEDALSDVDIRQFSFNPVADNLWRITIRAYSHVSGHEFQLTTSVFLEGVR